MKILNVSTDEAGKTEEKGKNNSKAHCTIRYYERNSLSDQVKMTISLTFFNIFNIFIRILQSYSIPLRNNSTSDNNL